MTTDAGVEEVAGWGARLWACAERWLVRRLLSIDRRSVSVLEYLAHLAERLIPKPLLGRPHCVIALALVVVILSGTTLGIVGLTLEVQTSPSSSVNAFLRGGADTREAFAVWRDAGRKEAAQEQHDQQGAGLLVWLARFHAALDIAVFVPALLVLTVLLARRLAAAVIHDHVCGRTPKIGLLQSLAADMPPDERKDGSLGREEPLLVRPFALLVRPILVVVLVAALALGVAEACEAVLMIGILSDVGLRSFPNWIGIASSFKWGSFGLAWGALFVLAAWWYFDVLSRGEGAVAAKRSTSRAQLRVLVADIAWRTRYVMAMLLLFAGLTIVMDQGRDVMVALTNSLPGWPRTEPFRTLVLYAILLITTLSVLAFSYCCWAWSRIMLRAPRTGETLPWSAAAALFAGWWERLLAVAPVLVAAWLCGLAARDAIRAGEHDTAIVLLLFAAALLCLIAAILFLGKWDLRRCYAASPGNGSFVDEVKQDTYRILRLRCAPVAIPVAALVLAAGLRFLYVYIPSFDNHPPAALAIIALMMAAWTGAIGWLAQLALRQVVPWVLFLVLWMGAISLLGWADNHVITSAMLEAPRTAEEATARMRGMGLAQLAIALAIGIPIVVGLKAQWRRKAAFAAAVGVALAVTVTLVAADRALSRTRDGPPLPMGRRDSLDEAIEQWLLGLCAAGDCAGNEPMTVYFVTAEGGGVRAAYWTALMLTMLQKEDQHFARRSFSLSGVSGGAVGHTVWRGCIASQKTAAEDQKTPTEDQKTAEVEQCVHKLGRTDLLTPLLGALLFEDVLARVIPTSWCRSAGCGFMDRGTWFEATLEKTYPVLGTPLTSPASAAAPRPADRPYLFLNSTWVETGERVIASEIVVDWRSFPTARDQLTMLGTALPLSAAAHNSARFPFVNAIGMIPCDAHADDGRCTSGGAGHLADGGYFDNSGANTTIDILHALARCLLVDAKAIGGPCRELARDPQRLDWLRAHLMPKVVMIRNGVPTERVDGSSGEDPVGRKFFCTATRTPLKSVPFMPQVPRCSSVLTLYADLAGPAVTAKESVGVGSGGRIAEARLHVQVERIRTALWLASSSSCSASARDCSMRVTERATDVPTIDHLDLPQAKVLYPLGWYLSTTARTGMEDEAKELRKERKSSSSPAGDKANRPPALDASVRGTS